MYGGFVMNSEQIKNSIKWRKITYQRSKEDLADKQTFTLELEIREDEYLEVLEFLKATVDHHLGLDTEELDKKRKRLKDEIAVLKAKIKELENEFDAAKTFNQKVKAYFESVGIEFSKVLSNNMPF